MNANLVVITGGLFALALLLTIISHCGTDRHKGELIAALNNVIQAQDNECLKLNALIDAQERELVALRETVKIYASHLAEKPAPIDNTNIEKAWQWTPASGDIKK